MLSAARYSLVALSIAWTAGAAYADLAPAPLLSPTSSLSRLAGSQPAEADAKASVSLVKCRAVVTESPLDLALDVWSPQLGAADTLLGPVAAWTSDGPIQADNTAIREIRPLPGSLSLFFSAMLSIGGWHLVRSARHVHLGALPEWYHTDAPAQIGHAVSFDFNYAPTALCVFESAASGVDERPVWYDLWRELDLRRFSQTFLLFADPRGPPCVS